MNNVLSDILEKTKQDLTERKKKRPLSVIPNSVRNLGSSRAVFIEMLKPIRQVFDSEVFDHEAQTESVTQTRGAQGLSGVERRVQHDSDKGIALIAEIKLASPSEGDLGSFEEVLDRAKVYEKAGADAISIVVEKHIFKGDISFISKIKEVVNTPILMKDFIIDVYQIAEAKEAGADAVLLIARIVDEKKLRNLVEYSFEMGIEPVVEIDNASDIQKAMDSRPHIIAVNARDLDTFEVNVNGACEIIKKVPHEFIKLGFSGIKSNVEVQKYQKAGAKGILVGTSLMKVKNTNVILNLIQNLMKQL